MKKLLSTLFIVFTIMGCGRVKDGGADVQGTRTGYDVYNGGAFLYYGEPFSGTVESVDLRSNKYDPKIKGEYTVDKGLYISEFKKNASDASKETWYSGKVEYNKSTRLYDGVIKMTHDMYGEVKGTWNLSPFMISQILNRETFFGSSVIGILTNSVNVEKADIKSAYFKLGYRSSAKIRNKHIIEYKLTDTSKDNIYMEYKASKINEDGSFAFKMTLYKHTPQKYNHTISTLVKQKEIYKNAKKIVIEGIAKYNRFQNGKINYQKLDFDPTTDYTISGEFGKTYYDDMMYIPGNGGVIKPFTMQIFDNPDLYDFIMSYLLVTYTKEDFNKWINN